MARIDALSIARAYHHAWTGKNFAGAGRYLAKDLKTDTPINTYQGKKDFLEALERFGLLVIRADILAQFGTDHEAVLLYDLTLAPIGRLRVAEHFVTKDGRIVLIRHVHDTAALQEFLANQRATTMHSSWVEDERRTASAPDPVH